ncbi:hypothetical protein PTSG_07595 [Salpingoeca rosetta]|uniref:Uncharacterized protein n=1 Tax=Salpingoeca rosetta (strain ATCC 50818 / BSB-021) TaxID=946362 RepID=F2UH80_SALR5|nr:uncharacterized protein PTSG_07595 [Salpingoeca rosetta]EGD76479.1 hypothetical protein PTSG_07595 [Salpingoeca rosetta]|eukprot:XP_004991393.1 hypothetical protein PTSG_07595 [Salpingoeca rosetta]
MGGTPSAETTPTKQGMTKESPARLTIPFLEPLTPRRPPPAAQMHALLDSNHKKRKVIRNGLADRLMRRLNFHSSELNFWLHSQQQLSREKSLHAAAEDVCLEVLQIARQHGCAICKCHVLFGGIPRTHVFLHMPARTEHRVKPAPGMVLQVRPPWKEHVTRDDRVVLFDAVYIRARERPTAEELEVAASCHLQLADSSQENNNSSSGGSSNHSSNAHSQHAHPT